MIGKIVFIEPKSPERHVFSRWKLPRLGTVILATRLKQAGYDVQVFVEDVAPVDYEVFFSADLVGISTITSTAPRAYEFARAARRAGIPVVMGGPHVTFLPDEALQYCDYVFRGEADDVIVDLVRCIGSGHGLETFPSLSYHAGDTVVHNPPDLQAIPGTGLHQRLSREGRVTERLSSGDNVDGTTNIVPRMGLEGLREGYKQVLRPIYAPNHYYARLKTCL
ncbi:MAG: cobalamin-dependent protein [Phycisphaerae bacterium]